MKKRVSLRVGGAKLHLRKMYRNVRRGNWNSLPYALEGQRIKKQHGGER